jgi:carbon-monoxide dehydrogenase iron sulfur subunit
MVLVDGYKCITCAMCAMVCPFDVLTFYPLPHLDRNKTVAIKCDQCIDRQRQGELPACVEACKVDALVFGELNELVKQATSRLAEEVSVAIGEIKPPIARPIPHVEAWRQWGESVDQINNR